MKIKEKELNDRLYLFKNRDVIVSIKEDFNTKFELYNLQLYFNINNGMLYIQDYTKKNTIIINITTVCSIDLNNEILKIKMDNCVIIIKSKNWRRI